MEKNLDFIGRRRLAYLISVILIFGSWGYGILKGPKFGIDFTGGVLVQAKFSVKVNTDILRKIFKGKVDGVSVQNMQSEDEFLIKAPAKGDPNVVVSSLKKILIDTYKDKVEIRRVEMIGPTIGHELKRKGVLAVIYALLAILVYVAWRFELVFAVTSVIALFHDALITIGMMMVTGREFSLPVIAAILTVIGYSINDTIVVFDRIRENMRIFLGKKSFQNLVNESVNQTLSRTVITSLTTFFVVLCLFLFGGGVINDFSFALLVGIVVGTYSSIFVASSLVVDWYGFRKVK